MNLIFPGTKRNFKQHQEEDGYNTLHIQKPKLFLFGETLKRIIPNPHKVSVYLLGNVIHFHDPGFPPKRRLWARYRTHKNFYTFMDCINNLLD